MLNFNKLNILFIIMIGFFISCSTPVVSENNYEELVDRPDHESWDVRITITNAGIKRVYIEADYLEQYNDKNFIVLEKNVSIDFYDADEKPISNLSADKAEINERTNFLRAINNIIVKSDSGITLFTNTLSWDSSRELIFTHDSVMITTEANDTLYGVGFESDVNMERWKILKPRGVTSR